MVDCYGCLEALQLGCLLLLRFLAVDILNCKEAKKNLRKEKSIKYYNRKGEVLTQSTEL